MKKVVALLPVEDFWRPMISALLCVSLLIGLMTFRLEKLTPGFTEAEYAQRTASSSVQAIVDNPLHLHQKAGQFVMQKLGHNGPAAMRAPSALLGIAAVISMFVVLKNWYTSRIAALGTLLFATSSWTLHVSRLATTDINFLLPLILLMGGVWLHKGSFTVVATAVTILAGLMMLYVPGMIWLVLVLVVWQRKIIGRTLRRLNVSQQTIAMLISFVGLAPLIWAFIFNQDLIFQWLGLPASLPSPLAYLRNLAGVPLEIFIRSSGNPAYGIGQLPLLDAFTGFMVLLGAFVAFFKLGLDRSRFMLISGIIGVLLIALDGPVKVTFLLPIIYLLAAGGTALLLQQWFTVFPRNPVARALGVVVVSATVMLASYHHLGRYFIAWPNVPETKATFNRQP